MSKRLGIAIYVALFLVGGAAGGAIGTVATGGTKTTTAISVTTKVRVRTHVKRVVKIRRVQPTITRTRVETIEQTVTRPPTAQGVYVDLGQYADNIDILGPQWLADSYGGTSHIDAQVEYNGGLGCAALRYFEIRATLFDDSGTIVENALDNELNLATGSRVPFTIEFTSTVSHGRVELVVTQANC